MSLYFVAVTVGGAAFVAFCTLAPMLDSTEVFPGKQEEWRKLHKSPHPLDWVSRPPGSGYSATSVWFISTSRDDTFSETQGLDET